MTHKFRFEDQDGKRQKYRALVFLDKEGQIIPKRRIEFPPTVRDLECDAFDSKDYPVTANYIAFEGNSESNIKSQILEKPDDSDKHSPVPTGSKPSVPTGSTGGDSKPSGPTVTRKSTKNLSPKVPPVEKQSGE